MHLRVTDYQSCVVKAIYVGNCYAMASVDQV